jgi:hypothetical protein
MDEEIEDLRLHWDQLGPAPKFPPVHVQEIAAKRKIHVAMSSLGLKNG